MDRVRGDGADMVPIDVVLVAVCAAGEEAEAVGGADGAMAAITVDCNQHILAGIDRFEVVYEVRHLDGVAADILLLLWSPCVI